MGLGDELLGSGMARGAAARGKRIAFGDGRTIKWHHSNAHLIFRGNKNVAPPGSEGAGDLEWIAHYPGKRLYYSSVTTALRYGMRERAPSRHYRFIAGTQAVGELFFEANEVAEAAKVDAGLVLIEPNTKHQAPNKRWSHERYREVARLLSAQGYRVAQFATGGVALAGVEQIRAVDFRVAAAILQRARLYVGPEGGLHHAAAAVSVPAVVIFGGYISPAVTGYAQHVNIFTGDGLGCGSIDPCDHCKKAMDRITAEQVYAAAKGILSETGSRVLAAGA